MSEQRAVFAGVLFSWLLVLAVVLLASLGHQQRQHVEAAKAVLREEAQR